MREVMHISMEVVAEVVDNEGKHQETVDPEMKATQFAVSASGTPNAQCTGALVTGLMPWPGKRLNLCGLPGVMMPRCIS